ncbi:methylated-DNA--protein-cysteine methyltransferase-like isoform X1 [Pecten maximus]|uniref:methylated-DNA--protein-cysteine methyltransferase-like isoform X1 n=2 Tax=Pecten maximus TaxID=6579 RepID=UPI0014581EA5|nr:methylated-DNA--protein-cysteine methyltransferase-like isoform X1 [Pecten maximus]
MLCFKKVKIRSLTINYLFAGCKMSVKAKRQRCVGSSCHHGPTNTYLVSTPVGTMELVSCPRGLHYMSQTDETDENFTPDKSVEVMVTSQKYQDNGYTYKPLLLGVDWLKYYFKGQHKCQVSPSICASVFKEGSFTETVWKTLPEKVKFGQSVSYTQLANLSGNIKACRAVGAAMKANPIQLIIPCHRVLPEGGGVGNYSGGKKNKMKLWLLKHEGIIK